MKGWYSASELVGLPRIPTVRENVARKARLENWHFRRRNGRGGGREYAFESLPEETRNTLSTFNLDRTDTNSKPENNLVQGVTSVAQMAENLPTIPTRSFTSAPTEEPTVTTPVQA